MKFTLKRLPQFCGDKASFYTVASNDTELFRSFLIENTKLFEAELLNILGRIKNMGMKNGATDNFFRLDESEDANDEKVVAIKDLPSSKLRLYCVRMSDSLVVLGGGGPKPKNVFRWQDDLKLKKEAHKIMSVSNLIELKISHGKLKITDDGLSFQGDLQLN
ncbi:MAG: hypothetical protein ABIO55_08505 [Ginsengibacter sp.]